MKHVNIQEDFILGHHNLKAGQYGYVSVTRLVIDFQKPVMGNTVLVIRIVRKSDKVNEYILIGHLENKYANSGLQLSEQQFQQASKLAEQGDAEGLHNYCVKLANAKVRSAMQEIDDDVPF